MTREVRVYGPPGTGKTTFLAKQVENAARKHGSHNVMVASFTRAAATELASRGIPIDRKNLGTLHAIAYRQQHRPEIAQGHVQSWNKSAPHLALSGGGDDLDKAIEQQFDSLGDQLLSRMEVLRAQMIPREKWPHDVKAFGARWENWKRDEMLLDFTDLIENTIRDGGAAPGSPTVGFFDEVQDFTPLELTLVRQWGSHMDTVLLAGDDDQCIYRFKGATPDAFLDPPIDPENKRVLAQSWRMPQAVHRMSEKWIRQLSRREPKEYAPRDEEGKVTVKPSANWRVPEVALRDAYTHLEAGRTVMFLSTCSFMLDPLKKVLREAGLPFHNPYRRKRGDWNPLASRGDSQISSVDRMLAFYRLSADIWGEDADLWNWDDVGRWIDLMQSKGMFKRGAKVEFKAWANDPESAMRPAALELMAEWMKPEDLAAAMDASEKGDIAWLQSRMLAGPKKVLQYPLEVMSKHGAQALHDAPKIIIGTIHSVKGGESDVVYLFPDVSKSGHKEWLTPGAPRDSVVRQMYVGMTRAREQLVLCGPASAAHVDMRRYAT